MHDTSISELAEEVAKLRAGGTLTIAEFSMAGITVWEVYRDHCGVPHGQYWPTRPWPDGDSDLSDLELDQAVQGSAGSRLVAVRSSLDGSYAAAFNRFCSSHPQAPSYSCTSSLDEVLRHVIDYEPLTQWYELVALHRIPSGRLLLKRCLLFSKGARRGESRSLTIRCEPSDENGTAFAVIAFEQVHRFRLAWVESARLDPGRYDLTAELRRPGVIRFQGLPAELRADHRTWPELIAAVPATLDLPKPVHLICAVEISGTAQQIRSRLDRTRQLIQLVASDDDGRVKVSLVSYGPHSFDRAEPEVPPHVLAWAASGEAVLSRVNELQARGAGESGSPVAAQIECVLAELAGQLTGWQHGRPVLVAVGSSPPFPASADPRTPRILTCPYRNDWHKELRRLRLHRGITFGAIHDHGPAEGIWAELGSDAFASLAPTAVFDRTDFASRLGLLGPAAQYVPFPLIES